jgi:hypothetical protein
MLGALTIVTGAAIFASCVALTFSTVADARPEDKAALMVRGFARGQSAVSLGIVVGASLCVLGGIARSLYRPRAVAPRPHR